MRTIRAQSPREAILVAAAAALVILFPIDIGAGLAIGLSVLHVLYSIARPQRVELARVPGTTVWWTVDAGRAAGARAGRAGLRPRRAAQLHEHPVPARPAGRGGGRQDPAVPAGGHRGERRRRHRLHRRQRLWQAVQALRGRGVDVAMARLESERARIAARRTGIVAAVGADHVFRSVEEAVRALAAGPAPPA